MVAQGRGGGASERQRRNAGQPDGGGRVWRASGSDGRRRRSGADRRWRDRLPDAARRRRQARRGARATPWRSRLGRTARRGSPTTSTRAFLARAPGRLLGRALEDAGGRGRAMSISVSDPFVATRERPMRLLAFYRSLTLAITRAAIAG